MRNEANRVSLGAVHTHTHTHKYVEKNKKGSKRGYSIWREKQVMCSTIFRKKCSAKNSLFFSRTRNNVRENISITTKL